MVAWTSGRVTTGLDKTGSRAGSTGDGLDVGKEITHDNGAYVLSRVDS